MKYILKTETKINYSFNYCVLERITYKQFYYFSFSLLTINIFALSIFCTKNYICGIIQNEYRGLIKTTFYILYYAMAGVIMYNNISKNLYNNNNSTILYSQFTINPYIIGLGAGAMFYDDFSSSATFEELYVDRYKSELDRTQPASTLIHLLNLGYRQHPIQHNVYLNPSWPGWRAYWVEGSQGYPIISEGRSSIAWIPTGYMSDIAKLRSL
jgi:hypothetical protein